MANTRHDQRIPQCKLPSEGGPHLTLLVGLSLALLSTVARTETPQSYLHVELEEELVTVRARDVPLESVLDAIVRRCGLDLDLYGRLDARRNLTVERLSVPRTLRRVLHGHNYVLRYAGSRVPGDRADVEQRGRLWVYAREPTNDASSGEGQAPSPSPLPSPLDTRDRLQAISELADARGYLAVEELAVAALSDRASSVRQEAIYGLGQSGAEGRLPVLETVLRDPDPRVRRAAIEAIADIGGDESAWSLAAALEDEDDSLREHALYALGEIGGEVAAVLLQQALTDERAFVRGTAAELLEELTLADRGGS